MISLFRLNPEKVFQQMGYGMKKRQRIFLKSWELHREAVFAEERKFLTACAGQWDQLAILGAGSLFDVDWELCGKNAKTISFFDGDSAALSAWRAFAKRYPQVCCHYYCMELTGLLSSWMQQLEHGISTRRWEDALKYLEAFAAKELAQSAFVAMTPRDSAIISLNLLSQIPLAWQNLVEAALTRRYGKQYVLARETAWLEAFYPSARCLVEQHIRDIFAANPSALLLVSDSEYCHYSLQRKWKSEEYPVLYDNKSGWNRNSNALGSAESITIEIIPALYGVMLADEVTDAAERNHYQVASHCKWVWHIAPPGKESKTKGIAHLVEAFVVQRKALS